MDTSSIEKIIADCQADPGSDEELHELLAAIAERHGTQASGEALARGADFVKSYVEQVPYMMKVAHTAAGNVGLAPQMDRILQSVVSYWEQDDDIIPDHLGIIGLLDDAYCSLTSLQTVSDHFQLQTGKYLFPDNLTGANRVMRRIIGEPYVTDLDRVVIRTMRDARVVESMIELASEEKRLNVANESTIWSHGSAGRMKTDGLEALGLTGD
ncbi:YkvA family protein [Elongatibacter sediminis]|uniref:YkvA family protein n=1 Tax=Elongatibacter sediminis TaxID=3119006 RepID=A0AAW9RGI4_9GAMM